MYCGSGNLHIRQPLCAHSVLPASVLELLGEEAQALLARAALVLAVRDDGLQQLRGVKSRLRCAVDVPAGEQVHQVVHEELHADLAGALVGDHLVQLDLQRLQLKVLLGGDVPELVALVYKDLQLHLQLRLVRLRI